MIMAVALSLGVFFGNWLISPFIVRNRTFKDSFFIGLIAGGLCFGVMVFIKQ